MKGRIVMGTIAALAAAFGAVSSAQAAIGAFDRAWGKDVVSGGPTGFEICMDLTACKGGSSAGALGGELSSPDGIAVDSSGSVYLVDGGHRRIQKFSAEGSFLRTWGKDVVSGGGTGFEICTVPANCQGAAASTGLGGELSDPVGIAVDSNDDVYVADSANHRVEKFDSSGNFLRAWGKDVVSGGGTGFETCTVAANCKVGTTGALGGEFATNSPNGIASGSGGIFIYVIDRVNNRIQKFTQSGTFLRAWGKDVDSTPGTGFEVCTTPANCQVGAAGGGFGGEFDFPIAVGADDTGQVYVADTGGSQIQKFDSNGVWERTWGKNVVSGGGTGFEICTVAATCQEGDNSGGLGGELNQPDGVSASAGAVFISDPYLDRIQEFDPSGQFLGLFGGDVVSDGGTGFEFCADASTCKVGVAAPYTGGFMQLPAGLAFDGSALYVSDRGNNRVQRYVELPVTPSANPPAVAPPSPVATPKKKCKKHKKRKRSAGAAKKKCKKKRKK